MTGCAGAASTAAYVRRNGALEAASWTEAFDAIAAAAEGLDGSQIAALAGDTADCEAMTALADLMGALGSPHLDCRQDGAKLDATSRVSYLFNTTIAGIEDADAILLIGTNPRWEASLVNARIRKRWRRGGLKVGVVGPEMDLTYPYHHLGDGTETLASLAKGGDAFADVLKMAERPMLIVGMGGADATGWRPGAGPREGGRGGDRHGCRRLERLQRAAHGRIPRRRARPRLRAGEGGRDTAAICEGASEGAIRLLYLLGADELLLERPKGCFVVYQGHHGDAGARIADVILPGAAYTEKDGTYVNLEGRPQRAYAASAPLGDAREDWRILRALSARLGTPLAYDTLDELRARMVERASVLAGVGEVAAAPWGDFGAAGAMDEAPFSCPIGDFYRTDPITRASQTMTECSAAFVAAAEARTDG